MSVKSGNKHPTYNATIMDMAGFILPLKKPSRFSPNRVIRNADQPAFLSDFQNIGHERKGEVVGRLVS